MKMKPVNGRPVLAAILTLSLFLISTGPAFAAESGNSSDWTFDGAIYMWGAQMSMTTPGGQSVDLPFYQILDDLEFAFMGIFGARNDKWSILTDVIYLDLKQDVNNDRNFAGGQTRNVTGEVNMKSWIVTPTVGYAIHNSDAARVEIVGGARYLDLEAGATVNFDGEQVFDNSTSQGYWDGIIGLRAAVYLDEHWFLPMYADVGWGDSDSTWQAYAGVGYKFSSFNLVAGYRYLDYNFDDNTMLSELVSKGVFGGITFSF